MFRVAVLERSSPELPYFTDEVIEMSCNVDDETAERMAWIAEQLLEQGALEVWQTPVTAKKSRAAVVLSVLGRTSDFQKLAHWLIQNSTTFGLRYRKWDRLKLEPKFEERITASGAKVTFKQGLDCNGRVVKEKPEFDSVKKSW